VNLDALFQAFIATAWVAVFILRLAAWELRTRSSALAAEFEREFPGQCAVCSYRRYGKEQGFPVAMESPEHPCPEANGEIRP
jgi:hypothetical protein